MITIFFRHKRDGANSIEKVFDNIDAHLLPHTNIQVPYIRPSEGLIKNTLFVLRHRGDVNHITGEIHYIALATGRNTVLTIHDVGSALQGNSFQRFRTKLLWFWLPALIVRKITVISEFTRKELSLIIPFARKKIVVIHNAFCPEIRYTEKPFCDNCPTILHIGTKANKNLERTITALESIQCRLILVGKLTDKQAEILRQSTIQYENHVDVPYSEIVRFYQQCDIVSFPSLYEGFGVPILEANAAGRPIVAGDIPVLHEVGDNAACFVNPESSEDIRNGFLKVINDPAFRDQLVSNGFQNIKRFAPDVIAGQYNAIYRELAE